MSILTVIQDEKGQKQTITIRRCGNCFEYYDCCEEPSLAADT